MSQPKRKPTRYSINTGISHGPLEVVDIPAVVRACRERWFNQTLVRVNDSVVRLGIVKGRFHWHRHEHEDEFFFVLEGRLLVDLRRRTIELRPGQGVVVPRNILHRPRAPKKTVMLMVETSGIEPRGDRPKPTVCPSTKPRTARRARPSR